jgi:hypothetical protein
MRWRALRDAVMNDITAVLFLAAVGATFAVLSVTGATVIGVVVCVVLVCYALLALGLRVFGLLNRSAADEELAPLVAEGDCFLEGLGGQPATPEGARAFRDWSGRVEAVLRRRLGAAHVVRFQGLRTERTAHLPPGPLEPAEVHNRVERLRNILRDLG